MRLEWTGMWVSTTPLFVIKMVKSCLFIESHFSLVENTTRHIYLSCSIIDLFWANQLYKFVAHDLAFHAYIFQHSSLWLEDHPPWANSIVRSDPVCV